MDAEVAVDIVARFGCVDVDNGGHCTGFDALKPRIGVSQRSHGLLSCK